ncbi:transporter substrate-binding domain-containing diguanylate cyclase [Marinitoga aeolica]|uniref:GGDEF domain-containing protein n=1 Tax=Marinitoga aeolica TaxID=2809031 RepID=A0ABY8PNW0_9BACT|nr:GGDEF domain-containing protein [Marinitoga aeolica]WGS64302.1 GGDEF domain-containing protein [Marinitoga aeolica]
MKKFFLIYLYIFLIIISFSLSLKVGIYEYPPIIYKEGEEIKGILPEILEYIAKKEGFDIKYVYSTFADGFDNLKNDKIDIYLGVGYTKERDSIFDYNKIPFLNSHGGIFTSKNSDIYSFLDLNNKKVGVLKKDIYYEGPYGIKNIAKTMGLNIKFIEYDNYSDIFNAVLKKEIDAGVFDYFIGKYFYKKKMVAETPLEFYLIDLYIIYRNPKLKKIISIIDKDLKVLKSNKNSIYYEIIDKYINFHEFPKWLKLFLIISIITLFLLLLIIAIMDRIIKRKTKELIKQNQIIKRQKDTLEKLAQIDPLTNIYNRRAGFQFLAHLTQIAKRENKIITIGFIDVDNLKKINDTFGHSVGDKVLKVVAKTIKKHMRKSDIIARFGGDEFFIALYNCKLKDAKRIEENITNDLIQISKKENINYSVSFGFIEYDHKETLDSIISKADEIMYQNKRKKKH